mmetsp:Transcript_6869/g.17176  ORF Transcript_6869/g.17176 Transcript_6869/m.17176 type:complete len:135 (-) Transcript_6869:525-929(-)
MEPPASLDAADAATAASTDDLADVQDEAESELDSLRETSENLSPFTRPRAPGRRKGKTAADWVRVRSCRSSSGSEDGRVSIRTGDDRSTAAPAWETKNGRTTSDSHSDTLASNGELETDSKSRVEYVENPADYF